MFPKDVTTSCCKIKLTQNTQSTAGNKKGLQTVTPSKLTINYRSTLLSVAMLAFILAPTIMVTIVVSNTYLLISFSLVACVSLAEYISTEIWLRFIDNHLIA